MWSGKCPVGEMSVRRNVLVGKCSVGKVSFGEVSGRGIVRSEKCPSMKCPSGKCQSGNCPRGSASRGTVQSGNCPHTEFNETPFEKQLVILWWLHRWRQHFPEMKINQTMGNFQISASTNRIDLKFSPVAPFG